MLFHLPCALLFTGIAGVHNRGSKGNWNSSQVQNIGSPVASASSGTVTVQQSVVINM